MERPRSLPRWTPGWFRSSNRQDIQLLVRSGMPKPILKSDVRILRPTEYERFREGARTLENQTRSDALLLTGLRYVEAQRLQSNHDWVDGRFIHLPALAQRKTKRTQKERWVRLSSKDATLLPFLFKTKPLPTWKGWTQNLERWATNAGLDSVGLGPKTLRKTWESWLVSSYPERVLEVFLSQGHTQMTALSHYLGLPFTQADKDAMLEYVSGWA